MKLSKDQITILKKLISYKGYPEIDLQYEILDHVACKVEVLMEKDPKLALDDAFRKVHSEFGIFGFLGLAESYMKSIEKRYRRFFWEEFKSLFRSYRIIYPMTMTFILYWLSVNARPFGYELSLPIWGGIFFITGLLFIIVRYWKINKSLKNYITYKYSTNSFIFINAMMQVNIFGMRFLENPDYTVAITVQSILTWISIVALSSCFISIFLISRVLNRSIQETKKLQVIYEG
jgi:isoprenylcysteine carboxyl methyltransferase (ICMT) family protein YpbQ